MTEHRTVCQMVYQERKPMPKAVKIKKICCERISSPLKMRQCSRLLPTYVASLEVDDFKR